MTNDTSTLTGALREAGETLAANLTTQGVPSTWDEGLSTLIGKVLDITPGPTPSYDGVSLTSDKSILSYADSESATLTAQLLDGSSSASVSGVTVEFFKGSTSLGTATTNSNGVATKSYASAGSGDISLTAEVGSLVSETYSLSDRLVYDVTEYSKTGTGSATSVVTNNKTWDNTINWELTADIKVTGNSCRIDVVPPTESLSHHFGIGKASNGQLSTYVGKATSGEEAQNHANTMNNNTYYTVKVVKEGTTIKFYYGDTLLRTDTSTASSWIGNYSTESVKFTTWASNTIYMKNLSVKPL